LQSQVPSSTTRIQQENFDESEEVEQPAHKYKAINDIQWRRKEFVPNPVPYHEPAHQSSALVSTPISYFEQYFTSELIDKFAKVTNVYAMQNDVIFKPTDSSEIRQLSGLHMYMGCICAGPKNGTGDNVGEYDSMHPIALRHQSTNEDASINLRLAYGWTLLAMCHYGMRKYKQ
jgi:hypothetical protein